MNCSFCGTQLPQGAANCPQCGATTSDYYANSGIAPNDPTVISSSDIIAQQPLPPTNYGLQPYSATPPTPHDTLPYGTAAQDPYHSLPYQNPYEPYNIEPLAPPPPSPSRSGNHLGIIAGIALLVLLLIGGGVFTLLQYSLARNAATTTTLVTTTPNATVASHQLTAKGTTTRLSNTITYSRQNGADKIYSITQQVVSYGDVTGSYTNEETFVLNSDNTGNFSGSSTCSCIVAGKSGTLTWSYSGTSSADNSYQGQCYNIQGAGDLANVHGQGEFQGQGTHGTYSLELRFDS